MIKSRSALVAGGTGGIGEGIVKVLLESGWTVFVPLRDSERGDKLKSYIGEAVAPRLHLIPADLSKSTEVEALVKKVIAVVPSLELVVVSVGSSYDGYSLHKIPRADWEKLLTENISTHFNLQHEFLSLLHAQDSGVYVTLTGPEADFAHPMTGLMSILAAAQKMMARVEALETAGTAVRVYSVTSKTPIATRARGEQSGAEWIRPTDLGYYVEGLADKTVPGTDQALHVLESSEQVRRTVKPPVP